MAVVVEVEGCGKWSSCSHNAVEMAAAEEEEDRGNSKAVEDGGGGGDGGCSVVFCWC